ncbi:hypothetical protein L249_7570, partial [Ophiocordyceps polyrhachis-furcata BCC 54312]
GCQRSHIGIPDIRRDGFMYMCRNRDEFMPHNTNGERKAKRIRWQLVIRSAPVCLKSSSPKTEGQAASERGKLSTRCRFEKLDSQLARRSNDCFFSVYIQGCDERRDGTRTLSEARAAESDLSDTRRDSDWQSLIGASNEAARKKLL